MLAIDDRRPGPTVPDRMNLAEYVLTGRPRPDGKSALEVVGPSGVTRWTYAELHQAVMGTAAGLAALNLPPQSRVLMRLGNSADFPIVFLAAIAAGLCPVPTSSALGAAEIQRIADQLNPALVVTDGATACPEAACPLVNPAELRKHSPLRNFAETGANDPAYIVFTSGTSGQALGVVHAHRAILARQMMFDGWYGLTSEDRVLHAGAFNWTFTLGTGLLDPWTAGATALVVEDGTPVETLADLAAAHRATLLAGAPGVFRRMVKGDLKPLPDLRHGLSAGEKLSETLKAHWREKTGTALHEAFGQSECSTFISGSPTHPAPAGTLGYAQPGRSVAILSDNQPVERGVLGDIAVHASDPGLALGYLNGTLPLAGEWCTTGDQGVMRADGAIEYHGRSDDILTAGGFRISPLEVETAMQSCPGVDEAAAVDHEVSLGTIVVALHYTGASVEEATLKAHAADRLARFKQPRVFIHEQSLPRNSNGKLLRSALRTARSGTS